MKIILLKDANRVGKRYDIKDVADGFALNSLIPLGIAIAATASNIKVVETKKKQDGMMKEEFKKEFEYALTKLPEGKLHIAGKVNEKGHLFAGINKQQVIEEFKKETSVLLSEDHFKLEKPIKEIGEHKIPVTIDGDKYEFTVFVKSEK